jgi:hypothetical protein
MIIRLLVNGQTVEKNEGLRPHIPGTKIPDCVHVYRGISPTNRVFFHTSAACPRMPHLSPGESFKEASKYKHLQQIVVFCSKTAGTPCGTRSYAARE